MLFDVQMQTKMIVTSKTKCKNFIIPPEFEPAKKIAERPRYLSLRDGRTYAHLFSNVTKSRGIFKKETIG
jgi:hypothetical protein